MKSKNLKLIQEYLDALSKAEYFTSHLKCMVHIENYYHSKNAYMTTLSIKPMGEGGKSVYLDHKQVGSFLYQTKEEALSILIEEYKYETK